MFAPLYFCLSLIASRGLLNKRAEYMSQSPETDRHVRCCTSDWEQRWAPSTLWSGWAPCLTPRSGGEVEGSTHWAPAERLGIRRWSSPSSSTCPSSPCHLRKCSHTCLTPAWEERGVKRGRENLSWALLTVTPDDCRVNCTVQCTVHCRPGPSKLIIRLHTPELSTDAVVM